VNCKHVQDSEEEHHVIKGEYNSRCVETRGTDGDGHQPENEANDVRD